MTKLIDVHHHFLPQFYREALIRNGQGQPDGIPAIPPWDEAAAVKMMDDRGIEKGYLSISSPGVHFGDDAAARDLAHQTNTEAARLVRAHPGRYGFFASTPLPDVSGALEEIRYAYDVLGADGVVFESNFQGVYLGDEKLAPVYEELNRRSAVIFLHPTSPHLRCGVHSGTDSTGNLAHGFSHPMVEFLFETTSTVFYMLLSGTLARYPNLRVIVPHAGAALPIFAGRIELMTKVGMKVDEAAPKDMRAALRGLHYDLASAIVPESLNSLLAIADPLHLHYGSDFPFTPSAVCGELVSALCTDERLAGSELPVASLAENSRRLLGKVQQGATQSR